MTKNHIFNLQNFSEFLLIKISDANHKGSSNSQDSFQQAQIQSPPGSSSTSMDSYNSYPSQIQQPPPQQQIPPPQQQSQLPAGSNAPNVPSPNVPQSEFNVNFPPFETRIIKLLFFLQLLLNISQANSLTISTRLNSNNMGHHQDLSNNHFNSLNKANFLHKIVIHRMQKHLNREFHLPIG